MGATYTRQSSSNIVDGNVIEASDLNNEFNQLLAAFVASSGHTHDGTAAEGGAVTKLLGNTLTFGAATAGTDITVTFDGESNDGVMKWMEDEDYFEFSDDLLVASTEKLQFRDTAIYINSSTDGQLDLVADTEIQIAATTVDINGNVDISGTLTVAGELDFGDGALTNVGALQLDSIAGDADTDTSITFSGSDVITVATGGSGRLTIGDGALSPVTTNQIDLGTASLEFKDAFFDGTVTADAFAGPLTGNVTGNASGTAATVTTAAQSNITSLGTLTTLTVDNVITNGATIGHTDDTDLLTLADGVLTVAGEVDATSLDISGDADIDGTLEADAITINGTAIASVLSPIAGGSGIVTTGAINSGSITSGFGTIDTGSSAITTTGLISGGSLDIDNVLINGTTIGHTDDTDLITVADGLVTVAGEISTTTLDIGGTNVTTTAAELNLIDGGTARGTTAVADGDGILINDGGVMRMTNVTAVKTYMDAATLGANSVDSDNYVDGSIDEVHLSDNSVDSDSYVDGSIDTAHIANDQITAALMADNSIDSDMYVDGSIDTAHIANDQITAALMADNSIDSDMYVDGSIDTAHIANDQITAALMADNSIDSDMYVDASIDNAHLADNAVDTAEIADNAITLAKLAGGTDGNIISFDASGDPVAIATGNDGQVLTSTGAGSPPAFEDAGGGAVSAINNATANELVTIGSTTTELDAEAKLLFSSAALTIGNATAEDTKIIFDGNAQDYHIGLDDSTDDLVIGLGSALGTTTHMAFDETGAVTKPLQPAFSATTSATQLNMTEDADNTIVFGLEIFDTNGDFASNTFTAPVAGKYMLTAKIVTAAIDHDGAYYAAFQIVTSNRKYSVNYSVRDFFEAQPEFWPFQVAAVCDMDASDTAFVRYRESGPGASQTDVYNAADAGARIFHQFTGYLLG